MTKAEQCSALCVQFEVFGQNPPSASVQITICYWTVKLFYRDNGLCILSVRSDSSSRRNNVPPALLEFKTGSFGIGNPIVANDIYIFIFLSNLYGNIILLIIVFLWLDKTI